jgi:hypothetical protein
MTRRHLAVGLGLVVICLAGGSLIPTTTCACTPAQWGDRDSVPRTIGAAAPLLARAQEEFRDRRGRYARTLEELPPFTLDSTLRFQLLRVTDSTYEAHVERRAHETQRCSIRGSAGARTDSVRFLIECAREEFRDAP